jgi:hypothetical protein
MPHAKDAEGAEAGRIRTAQSNRESASFDAGESLGGIFGKPAAEALTPDNQTAELYDPAAFHDENGVGKPWRECRAPVQPALKSSIAP